MAGISHRYSCIDPAGGFYEFGRCPSTAERMRAFDLHAPELAAATVDRLPGALNGFQRGAEAIGRIGSDLEARDMNELVNPAGPGQIE